MRQPDIPIDFFAGTRLTPPRQVRAAWLAHLLISRGVTMEGTLRRHPAALVARTAEAATTFCPLPLSAARIAGGFWRPDLLGGVTAIELTGRTTPGSAPLYQPRPADDVQPGRLARLTAIPYFARANRGPGPMRVWIPAEPPG